MKAITKNIIIVFVAFFPVLTSAENIWDDGDTPNSSQDTEGYSTSVDQVNTPQPTAAQQDATYTIKDGDTLWDLAFKFLGDPFEWQRIWEINPYIKNPDLIYPGDRLAIPGRGAVPAPRNETPALIPSETLGALDLNNNSITAGAEGMYPEDLELLSSLKKRNILSSDHLASVPFLWTEKDAKGYIYPGNGVVDVSKKSAAYQLFSIINVTLYPGVVYTPGDTVVLYKSLRLISFKNRTANIVKQTGRAVVKEVNGKKMEALLVAMSDVVQGKERVAAVTEEATLIIDTLVDPLSSISAEVHTRVEQTESPYPFQMCILDKGSTHGVQVGDVFAVFNVENSFLSTVGMIVHAGSASSTLCMMYMRQNVITRGDDAKLLRRTRFMQDEADEPSDE